MPNATPPAPVSSAQDSPFWRFSLRIYGQPGVGDACIVLQDEHGVDVNVLLFLLWQASLGRAFSAEDINRAEAAARPWRELSVIPLRVIRRRLKGCATAVPPDMTEAFRTRIKAVELEAERLQHEALAALAADRPFGSPGASIDAAGGENIVRYERLLGARFPVAAVETLTTALRSTVAGVKD